MFSIFLTLIDFFDKVELFYRDFEILCEKVVYTKLIQ